MDFKIPIYYYDGIIITPDKYNIVNNIGNKLKCINKEIEFFYDTIMNIVQKIYDDGGFTKQITYQFILMEYSFEISDPLHDINKPCQVYNVPFEHKMRNIQAIFKESDETVTVQKSPLALRIPKKTQLNLGILKEKVSMIERDTTLLSELEKIPLINENELFVRPSKLCVIDDVSERIHFVLYSTSFYYKLFGFSDDIKKTSKLLNELKIYDYIKNLSDDKKKNFVPVIGVYKIENSSIIEKIVDINIQKKSKTLYVTKTGKISESTKTIIDRIKENQDFLTDTIVRNIFLAVKEMHKIGIVHLDLHLGNFLVDEYDKVYIFDFDTSYLKGVSNGHFTGDIELNLEVIKKIDILKLLKNLMIYDINEIINFNSSDPSIYASIISQIDDDDYINMMKNAENTMNSIFGDISASGIIDVLLNSIIQIVEKKSSKKSSKNSLKKISKKNFKKVYK